MTGGPRREPPAPPSDDELAALLRARAARARLDGLPELARAVASAPGSRGVGVRFGAQLRLRRTWLPIGAVALVVIALVGGSMLGGALEPPEPDGSAAAGSPTPSALAPPGEIRAITAEELAAGLARDPAAMAGKTFAVAGRLVVPPNLNACRAILPECYPRVFATAGELVVIPVRTAVGADWRPPEELSDASGVDGVLAIRVPSGAAGSAPAGSAPAGSAPAGSPEEPLEYVGRIAPGSSGLVSAVAELPDLATWPGGEIVAVDAALTAFDAICRPAGTPPPGAERPSCRMDWLRDPALGAPPGGMPFEAVGLIVQPGAYEAHAPGLIEAVGEVYAPPVRATYLVRSGIGSACDVVPQWDCVGVAVPRWQVVGRLDPWPFGSSDPAATPAPEPTDPTAAEPVDALPAEAFVAALRAYRAAMVGRTFAVVGEVARDPGLECLDGSDPVACPGITFGAVGSLFVRIVPVGDIGPGPWNPDAEPLAGVHAIRVTADDEAGVGPILEYLGPIEPAAAGPGGLARSVEDLLGARPEAGPALFAVEGWLVRDGVHACPSPVPARGCPDAWLTPARFQPIQPGGGSVAPTVAIPVQPDAYERFAPDPVPAPPGVEPRLGTYLVQRVQLSCGPNTDCLPPKGWAIRERLAAVDGAGAAPPFAGLETLTAPELAKRLDGASLADLAGDVFAFEGSIVVRRALTCAIGSRPPECPPLILAGVGRETVLTWDPNAPPDWNVASAVTGRFVRSCPHSGVTGGWAVNENGHRVILASLD